jgi:hypothetical protein
VTFGLTSGVLPSALLALGAEFVAEFEDHVNAAIQGAFDYPWLGEDQRNWIRSRFGDAVVEAVVNILDFAGSHSEIWTRQSDPAVSGAEVETLVEAAYPFLSPESVRQAVNVAAYSWR